MSMYVAETKGQKKLADKHGTPFQFQRAVWRAYDDLFITHEEAVAAIDKYQWEWLEQGP
jgi:hypothetical protein